MKLYPIPLPRRSYSTQEIRDMATELEIWATRIEKEQSISPQPFVISIDYSKVYPKDCRCKECGAMRNTIPTERFTEIRDDIAADWVYEKISWWELLLKYPISRRRLTAYLSKLKIPSRWTDKTEIPAYIKGKKEHK